MALGLAKIAAKVSAVGGVFYWSVQQGIWGNSREGSEAGKRLARAVVDPAKGCIQKIPSVTDVSSKEYWNSGVTSLMKSVTDMGDVYTKKTKSATSIWDHTTLPDPKSKQETSKSVTQRTPGLESVPNPVPLKESKSESTKMQQSPAKTNKESAVPKVADEDMAKTISFKLSRSPNNEYIVEQIVTARSPKYEYSVEQVTKSRLTSPPPSRDRNWPIAPVKPKSAMDNSSKVVMRGYNYVTSVVSPPKSFVRVPTSVRVQSAEKPSSPTRCCNETSSDEQKLMMPKTLQEYETAEHLNGSASVLLKQIAACENATVMVQSAEKPSSPTQFCNEMLSDGQKLILPETLQVYESAEHLNGNASVLLKQIAACDNAVVYIDEAANEADNLASMRQAELSGGCYNARIAELIRHSYQQTAETTENEQISPTGGTLPGVDQFSPPHPMLFMPFCFEGPPSPILLSNTNPQGRLQVLRSPKQKFYTHALGRSDRPKSQPPASVLRRAIAGYSPPMPTVLMRPSSIFKGFSPAELARSLPLRTITDLHASKSSELGLRELPKRAASVSPQRSMIANIIPPTPSYILPSTSKQMRSGLRPKTRE